MFDSLREVLDCSVLKFYEDSDEDKQVNQEAYYSDFKPILGFPIPHRVDFHIGGALHSSMIINNIKANEGVVSWMFEPPPEAKESAVKSSD